MLVCSQLALLIAGMPPPGAAAAPSLDLVTLRANDAPLPFDALAQGTADPRAFAWFISGGYHIVKGTYDVNVPPLVNASVSENPAFSIDAGITKWNEELGVTLEGGLLKSSSDVDNGLLNTEKLDTMRYMIGLRLFDRGNESWLPYLRGGFMWRTDKSDSIDESGSGWYFGGGFDFYIGGNLRVGPQLLYTNSTVLSSQEWILGATVSFGF